ncbi:MAG: hypothetical protein ABIH23_21645 [bacterium]
MRYFEYEKVAYEAGIPDDKLEKLCPLVRQEFPKDQMMYELHVLRACMAIKSGSVSLEQVLRMEPTVSR